MSQQLEIPSGESLKRNGCDRALKNADAEWFSEFMLVGAAVASRGEAFTVETVLDSAGMPPGNRNSVGGAMRSLAKRLKLQCVGYRPSMRTGAHGRIVAIWQLL